MLVELILVQKDFTASRLCIKPLPSTSLVHKIRSEAAAAAESRKQRAPRPPQVQRPQAPLPPLPPTDTDCDNTGGADENNDPAKGGFIQLTDRKLFANESSHC